MQETLTIATSGPGLTDITAQIRALTQRSGVQTGLCVVFVQHTSCSLTINENADTDVRADLQDFYARLAPEGDPRYRHTAEGPDDMPAHIKTALSQVSLSIPLADGDLALGTWQGIFLWEHRRAPHVRRVLVHISG
jgi:secondary thiamine-phosphate synthase enzyme